MRSFHLFFIMIAFSFAASTAFGAAPSALASKSAKAKKPNVIYMMLDEWGYYELSSLGHPKLQTPVFDAFRKEGMRFTQAYAGGPVCGPTRAALLVGQYLGHVYQGTSPLSRSVWSGLKADTVRV